MSSFRKVTEKSNRGRRPTWRAEIFDEAQQRYRWLTLFPRSDARCRDPGQAVEELKSAWRRVRNGTQPTKRDATLRAMELYDELASQAQLVRGAPETVRELAEIEKQHTGKRRQRSVSTMNGLRRVLDKFVSFMDDAYPGVLLRSVRPHHVDHFLRTRRDAGRARSTQQRELGTIKRMFQLGIERGYLASNPCVGMVVSDQKPQEIRASIRRAALSVEEQGRLLEACSRPYVNVVALRRGRRLVRCEMPERPPRYLHAYVLAALETAARRGELLRSFVRDSVTGEEHESPGLLWESIQWHKQRLAVTGKTGPRQLALTPRLAQVLQDLRRDQIERGHLRPEVFLNDLGEPVRSPGRAFKSAVERAGIGRNVRLHDLRHTALTTLAQQNVPPVAIQRLAGHSSLRMTSHYLHADDDFMVEEVLAAAVRREETEEARQERSSR